MDASTPRAKSRRLSILQYSRIEESSADNETTCSTIIESLLSESPTDFEQNFSSTTETRFGRNYLSVSIESIYSYGSDEENNVDENTTETDEDTKESGINFYSL